MTLELRKKKNPNPAELDKSLITKIFLFIFVLNISIKRQNKCTNNN